MTRNMTMGALLLTAGLAVAAGVVFAERSRDDVNDAVTDLARARISIVQAIDAAEADTGGKAVRAELDAEEESDVVFQVEVVAPDGKVFEVTVDGLDGKVSSRRLDTTDRATR